MTKYQRAIIYAQDALAVAQAWLDHYAKGGPEPAWPLTDFAESSERFYDELTAHRGEHEA